MRTNLIGHIFGCLTVIKFSHTDKYRNLHWLCKCICGRFTTPSSTALNQGKTKSCGCLGYKKLSYKYEPTKITWYSMKSRCNNINHEKYFYYGGRGIKVCDKWKDSFVNFLNDVGERPEGTSIDRIDPYGDYEPSNCKWSTPLEQRHNRREK